jgi:hypothetical protein
MAKPRPEPINTIRRVVDAAAIPPPKMAGQEIAETADSEVIPEST